MNGLPTVRIDDILVHPRDNDLIVGTHGRSIWIIDDITALQQLTTETQKRRTRRCSTSGPATAWANDVQKAILVEGAKVFRGQNPARGHGDQLLAEGAPAGDVKIAITDVTGREIRSIDGTKNAGLESRPVEPRRRPRRRTRTRRWRRRWRCWRGWRWRWRARRSAPGRAGGQPTWSNSRSVTKSSDRRRSSSNLIRRSCNSRANPGTLGTLRTSGTLGTSGTSGTLGTFWNL